MGIVSDDGGLKEVISLLYKLVVELDTLNPLYNQAGDVVDICTLQRWLKSEEDKEFWKG